MLSVHGGRDRTANTDSRMTNTGNTARCTGDKHTELYIDIAYMHTFIYMNRNGYILTGTYTHKLLCVIQLNELNTISLCTCMSLLQYTEHHTGICNIYYQYINTIDQ